MPYNGENKARRDVREEDFIGGKYKEDLEKTLGFDLWRWSFGWGD